MRAASDAARRVDRGGTFVAAGEREGGGPHRLQVWARADGGRLARVYAGPGPTRSPYLGAWLVAVEGGRKLRLSDDAAGRRLWPTPEEAERAAKEAERAAKEAERAAKEAAEQQAQAERAAKDEALASFAARGRARVPASRRLKGVHGGRELGPPAARERRPGPERPAFRRQVVSLASALTSA